jgi:universal stress protein F
MACAVKPGVAIMKRILVCLDASPRAPQVLAMALDLAKRTGSRLRLLRAVGLPPEVDQGMFVHAAADVIETMKGKAKVEIYGLAKDAPESLIEAVDVIIGTPWDAICREAKSVDADLVVLGSHGYSGFDRILGTTAAKVVNHCDRSVLVVKTPPAGDK